MRVIATILAALIAGGSARAADESGHAHDRALRAVEEGRILPLREILTRIDSTYPGQMIEAELEDEGGVMVYEIKMLTRDGRVMTLFYDAGTGELLKAKGRGGRR